MNVEELSLIGPTVDLQTVDSIHKKRLLAFINHFVINTSSFLNKLSQSCEQNFLALESRIMKLETAVIILESKLSSIPGLDVEEKPAVTDFAPQQEMNNVKDQALESCEKEEVKPTKELDPVLLPYAKMLQFGVPADRVIHKMTLDGVDSALVDQILAR